MAVQIIRPNGSNGSDPSGWVVTGAASVHAALSDNSDTSYIRPATVYSPGSSVPSQLAPPSLSFGTFALPGGAILKSIQLFVRAATDLGSGGVAQFSYVVDTLEGYPGAGQGQANVSGGKNVTLDINGVFFPATFATGLLISPYWATGVDVNGTAIPYQTLIDSIELTLRVNTSGAGTNVRIYDVWVEVTYESIPTISGFGTVPGSAWALTNTPTWTWTYADAESVAQKGYDIAIWKTADVTTLGSALTGHEFDASVGGLTPAAAVAGTGSGNTWKTSPALVTGTAYTAYIRVYQDFNGGNLYSATSSQAFTVSLLPAKQPVIDTAVWSSALRLNTITAHVANNLLSLNQSSIETDASGWNAGANTAIARTTAQALSGAASLSLTSAAAGNMLASLGSRVAVVAGKTYTIVASYRSAAVARSARVSVSWHDSAGAVIGSAVTGSNVTTTTSGWTQATLQATAPAGAVTANTRVEVLATAAANEVHYADQIGIWPGTDTTWRRGGLVPGANSAPNSALAGWLYLERSDDGGTTFAKVAKAAMTALNNQEATFYDSGAPPNSTPVYRLDTLNTDKDGYTADPSAKSSTLATAANTTTAFWLVDPADSTANGAVQLSIAGDMDATQDVSEGRFRALGRNREIIVSDVAFGEVFSLPVVIKTNAERDKLENMLDRGRTLVLKSDTTEQWWVRRTGARSRKLYRNITRKTTPAYLYQLELTEVDSLEPVT